MVFAQAKNSVTWEDCEAFDNKAFTPYTFVEGQGFQFDDYTSYSTARRCKSHDNSGAGFTFNNTADCSATGLRAYRNARRGLTIQNSRNVLAQSVTLCKNNLGGTRYPSSASVAIPADTEEVTLSASPSTTLRNIAIKGRGLAQAINVGDATSAGGSTCNGLVAGGVSALFGGAGGSLSGSAQLLADPVVSDTCIPQSGSPLLSAGVSAGVVLDAAYKSARAVPTVGAHEYIAPRTSR